MYFIFTKYGIAKCFLYLNLTYTDSCSFTNVFVRSDKYFSIKESATRYITFETLVN